MNELVRIEPLMLDGKPYDVPNLLEEISIAMEDDPEAISGNKELIELYAKGDPYDRYMISNTLYTMCGVSFEDLLRPIATPDLLQALEIKAEDEPPEDSVEGEDPPDSRADG